MSNMSLKDQRPSHLPAAQAVAGGSIVEVLMTVDQRRALAVFLDSQPLSAFDRLTEPGASDHLLTLAIRMRGYR